MAPTTKIPDGVRLTPLAALLDAMLRNDRGIGLGTYLAIARTPGTDWLDFDTIANDLTPYAGGRTLNRVTIETFTHGTFAIPNTRYIEGRSMPRPVSRKAVRAYVKALDPNVGLDLDRVRQAAYGETDTEPAATETETAA